MTSHYWVLGGLLATHLAFLAWPSQHVAPAKVSEFRVGVVLDVGGRGDKSFNDGAWNGVERARGELGIDASFIEPGDGPDREAGLRLLASEGHELVVGVGFIFTDDLIQLAKEYPKTRFAGVDLAVKVDETGAPSPLPENLVALKFREEEGSFLVGAIAALSGGSKTVGFVGGMDIPLIHKFEDGYRQGVLAVCPDCSVVAQYAGVTPEAFRNPGKGKELALSQYALGANVIFHASGSTGLGVFEAARSEDKWVIGVDADQYDEAPGHVLTSMTKGIDTALFETIKSTERGSFVGGVTSFGLAENGVGFVYDDRNEKWISAEVMARVTELREEIVSGKRTVKVGR